MNKEEYKKIRKLIRQNEFWAKWWLKEANENRGNINAPNYSRVAENIALEKLAFSIKIREYYYEFPMLYDP